MGSALASKKLSCELCVTHYDFDPDGTDPVYVAWVDMRDFGTFMASLFHSVGTGNIDTFKIYASESPTGAGTPVLVKSATVDPDAVGDYVFLECTAAEIAHLDTANVGLRYVALAVELASGTDECVITYIRGNPRFPREGLTSDVVA